MEPALILDAVFKLLDKIIPDPQKREEMKLALKQADNTVYLQELQATLQQDQSQSSTNEEEAKSENLFVAGWRPWIGWVCGISFAYHFVLQPFIAFIIVNTGHVVQLPDFDMTTLSTVLMGMLGLGGMRTIEKINFGKK